MIMRHAVITCNTDRVILTGVSSEPSILKRNFNHSLYLNLNLTTTHRDGPHITFWQGSAPRKERQ